MAGLFYYYLKFYDELARVTNIKLILISSPRHFSIYASLETLYFSNRLNQNPGLFCHNDFRTNLYLVECFGHIRR